MDSNVEACAECTRSCLSLHRAKIDPYPVVRSFFKVMYGKEFLDNELIVPSKFARTLKSLVGKNTYLEDSTGQKWDAHMSKVKGSLVFKRGWHEFSLDHGIAVGDFVVFHYITGSHFIVQIFNSTGCERPALFNEKDYQNRRSKATKDSATRKGSNDTSNTDFPPKVSSDSRRVSELNVDSGPRQGNVRKSFVPAENCPIEGSSRKRPKVVPAEDSVVEPYFMTNRNTSCDDRDYLFDLSAFEMPAKKVNTGETSIIEMNRRPQGLNQSQEALTRTTSVDVEGGQIAETSPLRVSDEACLSREEPNLLVKTSSDILVPSNSNTPQKVATPVASAAAKSRRTGQTARTIKKEPPSCQNDGSYWVAHDFHYVEPVNNVNKNADLGIFSDKIATNESFLKKMVKPEPVDFCNYTTSAVTIKITSTVQQDDEPFLELPECLPIKICRHGLKMDQKLIVLRDPAGKRWPVIYQERKGIKILANGWKEFRKYNNIQLGDQCTFALENIEECIFRVDILRS